MASGRSDSAADGAHPAVHAHRPGRSAQGESLSSTDVSFPALFLTIWAQERIANKTKEVQVLIQRGLHQFVPDVTQDLIGSACSVAACLFACAAGDLPARFCLGFVWLPACFGMCAALKQRYYDITGEWLHVAVASDFCVACLLFRVFVAEFLFAANRARMRPNPLPMVSACSFALVHHQHLKAHTTRTCLCDLCCVLQVLRSGGRSSSPSRTTASRSTPRIGRCWTSCALKRRGWMLCRRAAYRATRSCTSLCEACRPRTPR